MISKSPERNTFHKNIYLESQAEKGLTPENDENTRETVKFFESFEVEANNLEANPEWQKNNLEWDLRTTGWILEKARSNKSYAQNIYAALCNNGFVKLDIIQILKEKEWSCSWRYAGGIVADMCQEGDYIDWYCTGIRGGMTLDNESEEEIKNTEFVPEGKITKEIRDDFRKLGWVPTDDGYWKNFDD